MEHSISASFDWIQRCHIEPRLEEEEREEIVIAKKVKEMREKG